MGKITVKKTFVGKLSKNICANDMDGFIQDMQNDIADIFAFDEYGKAGTYKITVTVEKVI